MQLTRRIPVLARMRPDITKCPAQPFSRFLSGHPIVAIGLIFSLFLTTSACVTQRTYRTATAERDALLAEVKLAQAEVKSLEQRAEELQAINDQENRRLKELLARLQDEKEATDRFQQEIRARITSLHAKLAALRNDQRTLAREVVEAKKQRSALQALVARYQKELRTSEPASEPTSAQAPLPFEPAPRPGPAAAAPPATTPPPETVASVLPPPQPPPHAQPPAQSAPPTPPPTQPQPAPAEESWLSSILNWLSWLWDWIFS